MIAGKNEKIGGEEKTESVSVVADDGYRSWYDADGNLHREGGPARVCPSEKEEWWYHHGNLHRDGGPAVIWLDSSRAWYCNNRLNREDGPAIVCPDGYNEWWFDGERIVEDFSVFILEEYDDVEAR